MVTEFTHDYPLAKGRMAEVWAKCECPICSDELEHFDDEYEDQLHHDVYKCERCRIFVAYISPAKYHEYHEVPDSNHWYSIESFKW